MRQLIPTPDAGVQQPERRYELVYSVLRAHLEQNVLEPGLIITESALARVFQVSRSPAAAALRRLRDEGLVSDFDGRGVMVGASTNIPVRRDLQEAGLALEGASIEQVRQRGWRDRLYPVVERRVAACLAFGRFRIVGADLAAAYGVSRTVAHEMLTRLDRVGLVRQHTNGHWYAEQLTARDVADHYAVRHLLEPAALRLVASALDPAELAAKVRRLETPRDKSPLLEAEIAMIEDDLHRAIVLNCPNAPMRDAIYRSQLPLIATHLSFERYSRRPETTSIIDEHYDILIKLQRGQIEQAAKAMEAHLRSGRQGTLACLDPLGPPPAGLIPPYMKLVGR